MPRTVEDLKNMYAAYKASKTVVDYKETAEHYTDEAIAVQSELDSEEYVPAVMQERPELFE